MVQRLASQLGAALPEAELRLFLGRALCEGVFDRFLRGKPQPLALAVWINAPTNDDNHADSISLLFFDRFGSVHPASLKQQGRRFPLFIFEILTSTRRLRVSGSGVALTQRTHSQRAIGVIPFHRFWICARRWRSSNRGCRGCCSSAIDAEDHCGRSVRSSAAVLGRDCCVKQRLDCRPGRGRRATSI